MDDGRCIGEGRFANRPYALALLTKLVTNDQTATNIRREPNTRSLWSAWALATSTSGVVSWLFAVGAGFMSLGAGLFIVPGVTLGILVGWAQESVMKHYAPSLRCAKWGRFSFVGALLGWIIVMALSIGGQMLYNRITGRVLGYNPLYANLLLPVGAALFGAKWVAPNG